MRTSSLLICTLILFCISNVHGCIDKGDRIVDLKGFDHVNHIFPCMYSGFVEIDELTDSHLFYWYYPQEDFDQDAPLVLWLNGGPGASSQYGNLLENGPLRLVRDENNDIRVHSLTGTSWTKVANMLFLDQPVGVGYSYGDMVYDNGDDVRKMTLKFLQEFYKIHPEVKDKDFYIIGESYGGKYEPQIAAEIIDFNRMTTPENQIPLKGVAIGNGFVDPLVHRKTIREVPLALGLVQFDSIPEVDIMEKRCEEEAGKGLITASDTCLNIGHYFSDMEGGLYVYDARYPTSNATRQINDMMEYLNDELVISQLHAQSSTKEQKYHYNNHTVYENYLADIFVDTIELHQYILDNEIPLLLYAGNFDQKDGPYGIQEWMKKLKWKHMDNFYKSSRNIYYYESDDNGEVRVGGNYKQYENLSLLVVYNAGHLVPTTQLAASRSMLLDFIEHGKLDCHHPDDECNLDQIACDYMNDCNGYGDCQNGHCICDTGYFGADCSVKPTELQQGVISVQPTGWNYYELTSIVNTKLEFAVHSGQAYAYVRYGNIPTRSFFTSYFEGTILRFVVPKYYGDVGNEHTKAYIGLYNPHYTDPIDIDVVFYNDDGMGSMFWIFIALAVILAIVSAINLVYCFQKKKNTQYLPVDEDSIEMT